MFGFNKRSVGRSGYGRGGIFSGGGLRRAAIAGLGMLAMRWWRNRRAGASPATQGWREGAGQGTASGPGAERGPVW